MSQPFRVVRVQSRRFVVQTGDGPVPVALPKRLRFENPDIVDPIAVGDWVHLDETTDPPTVLWIEPRRNGFSRPASGRGGRRQLLAANLDFAAIVQAAGTPAWKPATIDRYLVLASSSSVPTVVCMNKIDQDPEVNRAEELSVYPALNVPVFFTSVTTGAGLEELRAFVTGKVGVLLGPSGVGKSSLLNALLPRADLPVGEVSDRTKKGMHTTTWVEMLPLPGGGGLVDSPGLRVLDLTGVAPEELATHFPEMVARAGGCRFKDCRHITEPRCAVKEALANHEIAPHRYDSYERIHASLIEGRG